MQIPTIKPSTPCSTCLQVKSKRRIILYVTPGLKDVTAENGNHVVIDIIVPKFDETQLHCWCGRCVNGGYVQLQI